MTSLHKLILIVFTVIAFALPAHISAEEINYDNGAVYTGDVVDGVPHGYGILIYGVEGYRYEGEWQDGVQHGQAIYYVGDGRHFEGTFYKGGPFNGTVYFPNGTVEGYWTDGVKEMAANSQTDEVSTGDTEFQDRIYKSPEDTSEVALKQDNLEEAERYMFRGEAAMEDATNIAGFQKAVREFKQATELAPGWPNAWFNLGVAQERAKDLSGAISSYRKYMSLAPEAEDYDAVRKNVIKLEYRLEEADGERRAVDNQRRADEALARKMVGTWQNPPNQPHTTTNRTTGKKYKCGTTIKGFRIKISAQGTQVNGSVIGTPSGDWKDPCKSWYTSTNVRLFKGEILNGRLVGTWNWVWYSSDGSGIDKTIPLDIGIRMSSSGNSFKEIHEGEEPSWAHEWQKER